jgi:nitrogen fixation protein NifM
MDEPESNYLRLKLAAKLFGKPLEALTTDELRRVGTVTTSQRDIEHLILTTADAAGVIVPTASIDAGVMAIRGRYDTDEDFQSDLARIGLDAAALRRAVEQDLKVEAVLEKVAARSAAVTETEIEIFWFLHRHRFLRGEARVLRHILVTINDRVPGSERRSAADRIEAIRARLEASPQRFAEQALKHSECPTAMTGGLLGTVPRGRLYPQLEAVAFSLPEGGLSAAVESELGYHLIHCETINPQRQLPFEEARKSIREHLELQRRSLCQKSWINALRRRTVAEPV